MGTDKNRFFYPRNPWFIFHSAWESDGQLVRIGPHPYSLPEYEERGKEFLDRHAAFGVGFSCGLHGVPFFNRDQGLAGL
jgi:hypothetical protein